MQDAHLHFMLIIQRIVALTIVRIHLLMITIKDAWINVFLYLIQVQTTQPINVFSNVHLLQIIIIKITFVFIAVSKQDILLIHQPDNVLVVVQMLQDIFLTVMKQQENV